MVTNWLITGAGRGLGRALAAAALARGDTVCGTLRDERACTAFEALAPGRAFGFLLDLRDPAAIHRVVNGAEVQTGGIDRLVNNAGYGLVGALEETSLDQARALFDVNLFGAIAMIQAVLPFMRARRAGYIINITSVSGLAPWSGTAIYGASKYALECIGQTLAQEVTPLGIRVMNVAPGGMRTDFAGHSLVLAEGDIKDYDGGAHEARRILTSAPGHEKGDPDRAAAAILLALDTPDPPLHLLLGEDALHYADIAREALQTDIDAWRELSLTTTADG
ncbi:oxidoreductase [Komagataeibacter rhaeticus]|uniref:oxidoreductase n=1 Tax=Komagataeibacter rhaeticus TaxID=215221 RepID=UPI0002E7B9E6|nr:oxidoreductase [Komagataeibacter rhaeticus]WPP23209.1 oxidoreductase [Komagataeibacter rhaeticus]